ncbi:glycosyltransferase [Clostridium perfringens]|nr:glycosyltransferase [Clostridium perfringens]
MKIRLVSNMNIVLYTNSLDYGGASTFFLRLNSAFLHNNVNSNIISFNNERGSNSTNLLKCSLRERIVYLRNKLKEKETDIIITNYGLETLMAKLVTIGLNKKVKIISVVHVRSFMWIPESMSFIKKYIFKLLIKLSFKICDKCVAVSNDLQKEILEEGWINEEKIVTIYNPVIEDDFEMLPKAIKYKEEIHLAIIGWIWDIKNQEEAIKAMYELGDKRYKLHIIGGIKDQAYYEKLINMINEFKLDDQVFFEGIKTDIFKELEKIDILLLTSKTEALPTVIIEALACGVPVISRDCKVGPREILVNGEYGFLYDSLEELTQKIKELSMNNEKYKQLSFKSIKRAADFRFIESMKKYIFLIEIL